MDGDASGQAAPRVLRLDEEARVLFGELRQEAMARARSSRGLAGGWHGKTPGRALRLALVYEILARAARGGPGAAHCIGRCHGAGRQRSPTRRLGGFA
jgi:hypothetical protein